MKIPIVIPHKQPQAVALEKIKMLLPNLQEKYKKSIKDAVWNWTGAACQFEFKFSGMPITGTIQLVHNTVEIIPDVPPLVYMKAKSEITKQITEIATELLAVGPSM